jgi:MOSC domain-containing protein YiiM
MDIIRRFLVSGRPGVYLWYYKKARLESETIQLISREKNKVTVKDIVRLYVDDKEDIVTMQRAVRIKALPEGWRDRFRQQIENLAK